MNINDPSEMDLDFCPLWNSKYPLSIFENREVHVKVPVSENKIFKHLHPLSVFTSSRKNNALNTWNLLYYLDGTATIRSICKKIIKLYAGVDEEMILNKIKYLMNNRYIVLIKDLSSGKEG